MADVNVSKKAEDPKNGLCFQGVGELALGYFLWMEF